MSFRASHTTPFANPYQNCNSFNIYFQARQIGTSNTQFTVTSILNSQELLFDYGDEILSIYNWHLIGSFSSETPDGEGNFTFEGVKYLGIRIARNEEFYYGYIKIEKHNLDVWIHEWGIHKEPNTPVFAGEKG